MSGYDIIRTNNLYVHTSKIIHFSLTFQCKLYIYISYLETGLWCLCFFWITGSSSDEELVLDSSYWGFFFFFLTCSTGGGESSLESEELLLDGGAIFCFLCLGGGANFFLEDLLTVFISSSEDSESDEDDGGGAFLWAFLFSLRRGSGDASESDSLENLLLTLLDFLGGLLLLLCGGLIDGLNTRLCSSGELENLCLCRLTGLLLLGLGDRLLRIKTGEGDLRLLIGGLGERLLLIGLCLYLLCLLGLGERLLGLGERLLGLDILRLLSGEGDPLE